jgi:polymerase delta-interacting protein 2
LAEVGKLEAPKVDNYDTGQMFLHRLFGYRGVVLFARSVAVSNRDEFTDSSGGAAK